MKNSKRIISTIMAILMIFSVCQLGLSVAAEDMLETVTLLLSETPIVELSATNVTRVAAAVNSTALGSTIVKATPSGVPYLTGDYVEMAYAGERPAATKITLKTVSPGISIRSMKCTNESVLLTEMEQESSNLYSWEVQGGQAEAGTALEFVLTYKWTDGNTYTQKCYSYVENIAMGGSYVKTQQMVKTWRTTHKYYATISVSSRILGQGVYYEAIDTTGSYGDYNPATDKFTESTAEGYTTSNYDVYEEKLDTTWSEFWSGWTADVDFTLFATKASVANIYIDKSVTNSLSDNNIRMNLISSGCNTDYTNSQITYKDAYAYNGLVTEEPASYASDTGVTEKLGYVPETGTNYNRNSSITSTTFTGSLENITDGSEFTLVNHFYGINLDSWNYNIYNDTYIPTSMVFHIVDKSALREKIADVLSNSPTSPYVTNINKGKNPQEWYYKSGWANFDTALTNANAILNQPDATQEVIDSAANTLGTMYSNLILKTADYSSVDAWYEKADMILEESDCYPEASIDLIKEAISGVTYNYNILYQDTVDIMARNLRTAVENVAPFTADYATVDAAVAKTTSLIPEHYSNYNLVDAALKAVVYDLPMTQQETVDAMAKAVEDAIAALIELDADYTAMNAAIAEATALNRNNYINYSTINVPLRAAKNAVGYKISRQADLDDLTKALKSAMRGLVLKSATKTPLKTALELKLTHTNTIFYDETLYTEWSDLVRAGQGMYDDITLTILDNEAIIAKADEITTAYNKLEASFDLPVDTSALDNAIAKAEAMTRSNYVEDATLTEFDLALKAGNDLLNSALTEESGSDITAAADRITNAISALTLKDADYTAYNSAVGIYNDIKNDEITVATYEAGVLSSENVAKYDSDALAAIQTYINSCKLDYNIESQNIVDAYTAEITRLTTALTAKVVTSNLDAAKSDFTEADETLYTAETWAVYKTAYDAALTIDLTSQTAINDAVTSLANAKAALKLFAYIKPDEDNGVVVDESTNFIFGLEEGISDLDNFVEYEGGTLEYTPTKNGFGTGTTVDFVVNGEVVKTYTIVIFGDVNGDGVVDSFDLAILSAISNQERSFDSDSANFLAGDIDGSGDVDLFDSAVIAQAVNGERTISQKAG